MLVTLALITILLLMQKLTDNSPSPKPSQSSPIAEKDSTSDDEPPKLSKKNENRVTNSSSSDDDHLIPTNSTFFNQSLMTNYILITPKSDLHGKKRRSKCVAPNKAAKKDRDSMTKNEDTEEKTA